MATKEEMQKEIDQLKEQVSVLSKNLTSMMVPHQDGEQTMLVPKHSILELDLAAANKRIQELNAALLVAGNKYAALAQQNGNVTQVTDPEEEG